MGGAACGGLRVERGEGIVVASKVLKILGGAWSKYEICGSIRRGKPECGDVDLVLMAHHDGTMTPETLTERIRKLFGSRKNGNPKMSGLIDKVQVDITVTTPPAWGAALMHCTGSVEWNIIQRRKAQSLGFMLNQYGLFKADGDEALVAGATEEEVYKALRMEFTEPKDREA